jgi:hypothetical protein
MMKTTSPCPRPTFRTALAVTAVSTGLLLAACGGGGGGGSTPTASPPPSGSTPTPSPPPGPTPPPPPASATAADEADAANAAVSGEASAQAFGAVYDTLAALNLAIVSPPGASTASAGRAHPQDGVITDTEHNIACPGGGTATFTIQGTDLATERNGQFDAGETYDVTYDGCSAAPGLAQLTGTAELIVTSVTGGANSTTPSTTAVTIALTNLTVALGSGSVVADTHNALGASIVGTLSRTAITANSTTTATSTIVAPIVNLATTYNARSGTFAVTSLDAVQTVTTTASGTTYQFSGTHSVNVDANGRSIALTSSTASPLVFDATGEPTAGDWTVVRSDASLHNVLAAGTVTQDETASGVDTRFTFPLADLEAAAG